MGAERISEAASEIRRGRPARWSDAYLSSIASLQGSKARSRRQQQTFAFAHKALRILAGDAPGLPPDSPYAWMACDDPRTMKTGILAELGRLDDPDVIRQLARAIAAQKLPVKRAVALLRQGRRVPLADDRRGLRLTLARCIRDYVAVHPGLSEEDVCRVLEGLADGYRA